jgi:hypothetical protein
MLTAGSDYHIPLCNCLYANLDLESVWQAHINNCKAEKNNLHHKSEFSSALQECRMKLSSLGQCSVAVFREHGNELHIP